MFSSDAEFQWRARAVFPAKSVVWSPATDPQFPMLFRKVVRYMCRIQVAPGHGDLVRLPLDVVQHIATWL